MKSFDFNAIQQPMLEVTLPNKEQTKVRLTVPSTALAERASSAAGNLKEIFGSNDKAVIQKVYELLAEIMSCNQELRDFTAEELKECLNFEHVGAFLLEYISFLGDLKKEKN